MAIAFDALQKFSFAGIQFLVEHYQVRGGLRDHVHEFPHAPGGDAEKLGRKLYTFSVDGVFVDNHPSYPGAWPNDINQLRDKFEQEETNELLVPTIGSIQAYAYDWVIDTTPKMRNGEKFHIDFREDQRNDILAQDTISPKYTSIGIKSQIVAALILQFGLQEDIFDTIASLVSSIQAYQDAVNLDAQLLATKVDKLANACRTADALVVGLDSPPVWPLVGALHDLCVAADNLNRDVLKKSLPLISYVTPSLMTISDVSRALYNDMQYAMEIMQLNPLDDPMAIPSNTVLRAYGRPALGA